MSVCPVFLFVCMFVGNVLMHVYGHTLLCSCQTNKRPEMVASKMFHVNIGRATWVYTASRL